VTRSFDATRLTTLAAIACLTDTVLRVTASDVPSVLSAHYSGTADGPGEAFCFDAGHFALESEYARFHDPLLVCTRGGGEKSCVSLDAFFLLRDLFIFVGFSFSSLSFTSAIPSFPLAGGHPHSLARLLHGPKAGDSR
jgi:hypothetical protein